MRLFLLFFLVLETSLASEQEKDFHRELNRNAALGVLSSSLTQRCSNSPYLPSYHVATNAGILLLEFVSKARQMTESRKEQKLLDAEVLKKSQAEKSSIGHDADFQYMTLNRMLAEEMDLEYTYQQLGQVFLAISYVYMTAEYYALIEQDIQESSVDPSKLFPPNFSGQCSPSTPIVAYQPFFQFMSTQGLSISAKYASVNSDPSSIPQLPESRAVSFCAMERFAQGLAQKYHALKENTSQRVATLRTALDQIRETRIKVKLPPYVYCYTDELKLFRTEYCEHPVDINLPEKEWKVSNPDWMPFNLVTVGADNSRPSVPSHDKLGKYIKIVHAKNTALWFPRTPTTLCYHLDQGVFFRETCKTVVETDNPVSSWVSEDGAESKFESLLRGLRVGTSNSPISATGSQTAAVGPLAASAIAQVWRKDYKTAISEVSNVLNYSTVIGQDIVIYRKRINDRRLIKRQGVVPWEDLITQKYKDYEGLLSGNDQEDESKNKDISGSTTTEEKEVVNRQMSAKEAIKNYSSTPP